jgi:hypothetical protein
MLVLALIWPSLVFRSIVRHISPVGRNVDDRAWKHVLDVALHPLHTPRLCGVFGTPSGA